MKDKQLKEQFNSEINSIIPNNKDIIKKRLGIMEETKKTKSTYWKPAIAFAMILLLAFGLSTYFLYKPIPQDVTIDMGSFIKTKQDVYAYGAFSTTNLLMKNEENVESLNNKVVSKDDINKINHYISIFESLTSEEGFKQETIENNDKLYSQYEIKMLISVGTNTYVAYYNETPLNDEDDEVEEDEEISTSLVGIMIMNNHEYDFYGVKEVEDDEIEISMTSKINDLNYVKVTQEIENDEQEFVYEVMNNGKMEYSSIEIEKEDGEVEVELRLGENNSNDLIYKFNREGDKLDIKVYEGKDNIKEHFIVKTKYKEDGTKVNEYIFDDNTKLELDD